MGDHLAVTPAIPSSRRGTVYIVILATVLLAFVMAVSGLLAIGVQATSVRARSDADQARDLAYAGVQTLAQQCADSYTWRSSARTTPTQTLTIGTGKAIIAYSGTGAANFLSLDQPVSFTSQGQYNNSIYRIAATLNPSYIGMDCLDNALCAGGTIIGYNSTIKSNGKLWSNTSVAMSSTSLTMDTYSASTITGSTYVSSTTANAGTKTIPDATMALDYYKSVGSAVTIASNTVYTGRLISPAVNPFGVIGQTDGIYAINCNGKTVTFQNGRIFGTLVFYNNTAGVTITNSNYIGPANAGLPVILTDGNLYITTNTKQFNESTDNLNPAGVPYGGVTDSNKTDQLAAELNGLFYATGNITIKGGVTLNGQVIAGGNITLGKSSGSNTLFLSLRYVPIPVAPPGFRVTPGFKLSTATILRSVDQ